MKQTPYWNPRHETMGREELTELQLHKFRRQLAWAIEKVPFHRDRLAKAKVGPADIRTMDDLQRIPFMTRDDWMEDQEKYPPTVPTWPCLPRRPSATT